MIALTVALGAIPASAGNNRPSDAVGAKGQRDWIDAAAPLLSRRVHYVGEVWLSVSNDGSFGSQHQSLGCPQDENLLKINWCPSFENPGGSRIDYLFSGGLWIGGIVGTDTVVSLGYEGWAGSSDEFNGFSPMLEDFPPEYVQLGCKPDQMGEYPPNARLEQMYFCRYYDTTFTNTNVSSHRPLGLEVTQMTHCSVDNFARNFVIFDLNIKNISNAPIENVYFGVFIDPDVYWQLAPGGSQVNASDDISGFIRTSKNLIIPEIRDTLNIGWAADNDGRPASQGAGEPFPRQSARGIMGWRILRKPENTRISFNWWTSDNTAFFDWGPRRATDLRDLGHGGRGTPSDDRSKYYYMSNGELDYDQVRSALNFTADGWAPPQQQTTACDLADGRDTRSIMAAGPVSLLMPGESVPFTFAIVGGKNLHTRIDNPIDCLNPQEFYNNLDFSDLEQNAWWAGFVFDNFGVDSDGDQYAGEYYPLSMTNGDTVYYSGDRCPDFSGPAPPRGPDTTNLKLTSRPLEMEVNWTGLNSEVTVDPLLRSIDFEGYNIYIAERNSSNDIPSSDDYSLLASWDIIDFGQYLYDSRANKWNLSSNPRTTEEWRQILNDPTFDPTLYPSPSYDDAYTYVDNLGVFRRAYFPPQGYNQSDTILANGVKTPNLIQRVGTRDTVISGTNREYGVYRVVLKDLLPSKHYFISVTAFDYGDPLNNLDPLESVPGGQNSRVDGIPIYSADVVENYWEQGGALRDSVRVIVYPNPYKSVIKTASGEKTSYFELGFEGNFGQSDFSDLDRRIHFINLPDRATVSIYTLDGDLVRELHHPDPQLSSYPSKISWDLVSRNTQAVESGIYIYRVDSDLGSQIGKIVIIK